MVDYLAEKVLSLEPSESTDPDLGGSDEVDAILAQVDQLSISDVQMRLGDSRVRH